MYLFLYYIICLQVRKRLVHFVHSALIPVRVRTVSYWLNGVTNWIDPEVTHSLIGDSRGSRTYAMHGSFRMYGMLSKALQNSLLTAFSRRLMITFDVVINILSLNAI